MPLGLEGVGGGVGGVPAPPPPPSSSQGAALPTRLLPASPAFPPSLPFTIFWARDDFVSVLSPRLIQDDSAKWGGAVPTGPPEGVCWLGSGARGREECHWVFRGSGTAWAKDAGAPGAAPGGARQAGQQEGVALSSGRSLQALKSSLLGDSGSKCVCLRSSKPAFCVCRHFCL